MTKFLVIKPTAELKKHKQNYASNEKIRCKQLAEFMASTEAEEPLLAQRLRDSQTLEVLQVMNGGLPNINPYTQSQDVELPNTDIKQDENSIAQANEPINPDKLQIFNKY